MAELSSSLPFFAAGGIFGKLGQVGLKAAGATGKTLKYGTIASGAIGGGALGSAARVGEAKKLGITDPDKLRMAAFIGSFEVVPIFPAAMMANRAWRGTRKATAVGTTAAGEVVQELGSEIAMGKAVTGQEPTPEELGQSVPAALLGGGLGGLGINVKRKDKKAKQPAPQPKKNRTAG